MKYQEITFERQEFLNSSLGFLKIFLKTITWKQIQTWIFAGFKRETILIELMSAIKGNKEINIKREQKVFEMEYF